MTLLQSGAMTQYGAQRLSTARRFATKAQKKRLLLDAMF